MQFRMFRCTAPAAVLLATALAAAPARSAMHLRLKQSDPAADTTLTAAPAALRFWFTEDPDVALFTTRLTAATGGGVTLSRARWESEAPGAPIVVDITGAMAAGPHTVSWKAMSDDGHPVTGEFRFTVAPGGGAAGR